MSAQPNLEGANTEGATAIDLSEKAGDRIGDYKLLEKLGEGGMGVVYLAEQEQPVWRQVALKIIKLGMDTKSVIARFEAERQALALMDHPNIAKVLEAGSTETGRPFFVMELIRGVAITEYSDKNHLSARQRLELFLPVCQAIQHAHQKGIIHRDLKPSNVLVTLLDGRPVPMVIDFGIAKATHQKLTEKTLFTNLGQMIGTPAYMSPEQAEMSKLDVDTRSDIYSLGVLLYELLTGTTPFPEKRLRSAGFGEMQRIIAEEEPERPSTRLSTMENDQRTTVARNRSMEMSALGRLLRGDLDWIAMKCLEKDRTRRYETVNGLEADIQRHLNNEPINARPPSAAYRFQKMVRRNKVAFAGGAAVIMALLIGTIGMTALYVRSERLRKESQRNLYVADMNLAQQAWEQNNVGRVRELLEETAVYRERGFEWYYWQWQTHLELNTLRGHLGPVLAVAYSPDGQRIVTGSADQTAKIWHAPSGRTLLTLKGHRGTIGSAAFSSDGQRIVTGSSDQTIRVWSATSGKLLLTITNSVGGSNEGIAVAFSPDGWRIASGGGEWTDNGDQTAKVWNAVTGRELLSFKGHRFVILSVAFSPDGQRIVTSSGDGTAKVWDAVRGKELFTLMGHSFGISSVGFSWDSQRIVTGSWDRTARVWDAISGKELFTLKGHSAPIHSVAFSPDDHRIVTGSGDSTGSGDRTAKVWDAVSGKELFTLKGHSAPIHSVAFAPDGRCIVTGSSDGTAKVWEASADKEVVRIQEHNAAIYCVAFSPDGQELVTAEDATAKVWDTVSGQELLTLKGQGHRIRYAAFSPDGQRIVSSGDGTARVWDAASGQELLTLGGQGDRILYAAFSPNGQRIVSVGDQAAKVWDAARGRELLILKRQGHRIAFSPDGQRIVSSGDGTASVWDAASGQELLTLGGQGHRILHAAFSPDGQRIVTGSLDQTAKVWEVARGKELLTLKGHNAPIHSVAFSPDGRRIVTGSSDGTTKVWETDGGKEVLTLKEQGDKAVIWSVAFSPDGRRIATGSNLGTVKLWKVASPEQVAAWQKEEQAAAQR